MKNYEQPFDLIFSLGDDCACSYYLREFKLQNASYPLDWVGWAPIECAVSLIVSDFKDFLAIDSFEPASYPNPAAADTTHGFYKNKKSGLYTAHDFPVGIPLDQALPEVEEKYNRRIKRFYTDIAKARKIMFVWLSKVSKISDKTLIEQYERLKNKFPNQEITCLILENDSSMKPLEFKETQITKNITKIVFDNVSYDVSNPFSEWRGNRQNIEAVFSRFRLKTSKEILLRRFLFGIVKAACLFIPLHSVRNKWRKKMKVKLLGE